MNTMPNQQGHGMLRVSVYKSTSPTESYKVITTFISDTGTEIQMDAGAFFDGIVRTEPFKDTGYRDFLDMFHDKKIKSIVIKDRRDADDQLRTGIEKTNRWAYEEKNSLKYQIKSLKHKVLNTRKKFKVERILRKK